MDTQALQEKLIRYAYTLPTDCLRCSLFWLALFFVCPFAFLGRSLVDPARQSRTAARILLGLLAVKPSKYRIESLLQIFAQTKIPLARWPLAFCALPESAERRWLGFFTPELHHSARLTLVRQYLPPAKRILDLGGSCGGIPEGALLHMGYPHAAEEVVIVDLPLDKQFAAYKAATLARPPAAADHQHGQTLVRTVYTPMTDLSGFASQSFDLVWSGQSIEHITMAEARRVFSEVARVLKPGGHFCLDTPNRTVSSLLTRVGMLHPEHKFEYTPDELIQIAEEQGFRVTEVLAETAMPFSKAIGRYCRAEACLAKPISSNPNEGLSFFMHCRLG